jgi:hypothetical protein
MSSQPIHHYAPAGFPVVVDLDVVPLAEVEDAWERAGAIGVSSSFPEPAAASIGIAVASALLPRLAR